MQSTTKAQRIVLAKAIMRAEIEALTDIRKDEDAHYAAIVSAQSATSTSASSEVIAADENLLLSEAASKWIDERGRSGKWGARRADACDRTIQLLIEIVGDKRIAEYGKADARDFKAILCDLPPNRSELRETRELDVREAAKTARALNPPMMTTENVNKQLTIVGDLFDWIVGHYAGAISNPFAKTTLPIKKTPRLERDPFTTADLQAIFSAPIFTGCKSESRWQQAGDLVLRTSAKFWLPLLGLYTGARLNELCKLKVTDIREADGIDFIDINTEPHKDAKIHSGAKSSASVRRLPIHADLIAFGFLEFVARRRGEGSERLFVELKPDKYGKLADGFGKHFHRFLRSLGIKREKIDFHSFRRTWTDACLNSRISSDVTLALKGVSRPGTLARYGHGKTDLEILAEDGAKPMFKGVPRQHSPDSLS